MSRRKSKSEKTVTDSSLPWPTRVAAARTAVDQLPPGWQRDLLYAFFRMLEEDLPEHFAKQPAEAELVALRP